MPPSSPRRAWHSSMIVPMNSLGAMIVRLDDRLEDRRATLPSGQSDGLVTTCSVPSSITTR